MRNQNPSANRLQHENQQAAMRMKFSFFRKKPLLNDAERLKAIEVASNIVADFGEVVEKDQGFGAIQDTKCLPHRKDTILSAICVLYRITGEKDLRELMKLSAYFLSFFQDSVGSVALYPAGMTPEMLNSLPEQQVLEAADRFCQVSAAKFETFKAKADADWRKISAILDAIP